MKHGTKALNRLQARRKAHDAAFSSKAGHKRPGSLKKSFPRGKRVAGNDHSANTWSNA